MPTYYIPLKMERNSFPNVSFRLKVNQHIYSIKNNKSQFFGYIQYINSGEQVELSGDDYKLEVSVVGSSDKGVGRASPETLTHLAGNTTEWTDIEKLYCVCWVTHDSNGGGNFTLSVEFKADPMLLLPSYYKTLGTASYVGTFEQIDVSEPAINDFSISADRYGLNASTQFTAEHSSYPITSIYFSLYGLSREQAESRRSRLEQTGQFSSFYYAYNNSKGVYYFGFKQTENLSISNSIAFSLDALEPTEYPLNSGSSYDYELTVTCENGKTAIETGTLTVPQKVTGVTCDEHFDLLPEQTVELSYTVSPANAEEKGVIITSSDPEIAEVDDNGIITAKAEGACIITVTTIDGGFVASCSVNVQDASAFPILSPVTYLTAVYLNRIILACDFVRDELVDGGASVAELTTISLSGKSEPVTNIMTVFQTVESNCQTLRAAAVESGIVITSLPSTPQTINKQNSDWYVVVNNWIAFLNELHAKINGG